MDKSNAGGNVFYFVFQRNIEYLVLIEKTITNYRNVEFPEHVYHDFVRICQR